MSYEIVPLTGEHIVALWGKPPPSTVYGMAVVSGDNVLSVCGIYIELGRFILVSKTSDEAHKVLPGIMYSRAALKVAKKVMDLAGQRKMPVNAIADPEIYGSENMLRHLGFSQTKKDVWSWPGSYH